MARFDRNEQRRTILGGGLQVWSLLFLGSLLAAVAMTFVYPSVSSRREVGAVIVELVTAVGWFAIGRPVFDQLHRSKSRLGVLIGSQVVLLAIGSSLNPNAGYLLMPVSALVYAALPLQLSLPSVAAIEAMVGVLSHFLAQPSVPYVVIADWFVPTFLAGSFVAVFISRLLDQQADLSQSLDELRITQSRLSELYRQIGENNERERLAARIHETIAQQLIGILLLARGAKDGAIDAELIAEAAQTALEAARAVIREGQLPATTLASVADEVELLKDKLQSSGVTLIVEHFPSTEFLLDSTTTECMTLILREVGNNIIRHSRARTAHLDFIEEEGSLIVVVEDDGVGFDTARTDNDEHFGLELMRRRVEQVFGDFSLESHPEAGTRIKVRLPR
ncbi:ATP-binding protein [Ferrimicrobium sp.]|uniref:sensor histidine kinase n=1 Tax=Ferrimicrobium sp. TaxID=2926050 RepID=UPI00262DF712|nr:ATP-binding protein [Ferrimicrobium sp.]